MMEILVRGNKIDITDAMKDYVKEKLSKLEKYTLDDDVKATVLVKVRNYTQKVEVTIPLKTLILRAEEESEDFYSAVDLVVNKLERQIRKNKTKPTGCLFTNVGVHASMLLSPFISPSPSCSPPLSVSLFSMSASPLQLCEQTSQTHPSRFHVFLLLTDFPV